MEDLHSLPFFLASASHPRGDGCLHGHALALSPSEDLSCAFTLAYNAECGRYDKSDVWGKEWQDPGSNTKREQVKSPGA